MLFRVTFIVAYFFHIQRSSLFLVCLQANQDTGCSWHRTSHFVSCLRDTMQLHIYTKSFVYYFDQILPYIHFSILIDYGSIDLGLSSTPSPSSEEVFWVLIGHFPLTDPWPFPCVSFFLCMLLLATPLGEFSGVYSHSFFCFAFFCSNFPTPANSVRLAGPSAWQQRHRCT